MNKLTLLLGLFLTSFCSLSAQITFRGKITNVPPSGLQVAMVEYWSVDRWQQLAVIQLEAGGAFSVTAVPHVQAQARIRMASQSKSWSDFVLPVPDSKKDTVMVFDLDMKAMNGNPARVAGSAENELYFKLMTAYQQLAQLRDSTAKTPAAQLQKAEHDFNLLCKDMSKQHMGSFTGDIVANLLYQPSKEDYTKDPKVAPMTANQFVIAHSLDKVPFRYDRTLNHNAFLKVLNRYFDYFDTNNEEGTKAFIDGVMARRSGSEAVDVYLFKHLLDKMLNWRNEAGLHHLLTWYLPDCTDDSPLPDYTRTLIQALQNCEPGKAITDAQMPDVNGNNISIADVCAKNKITLLFFWKSNCSHCKEFKPVLMSLYEKYRPLGVEVYALSLDKTEPGWKETLQNEPTKWINVFIPGGLRQEINQKFPVLSTPTLISLDKDHKVLSRLILREQLEEYLKETLAKLGNG